MREMRRQGGHRTWERTKARVSERITGEGIYIDSPQGEGGHRTWERARAETLACIANISIRRRALASLVS